MSGEVTLKKTETLDRPYARATYNVLLDGKVIGDVTKYEKQRTDYRQRRGVASQVWVTHWEGRVHPDRDLALEHETRGSAAYEVRSHYIPEKTG